MKTHEQLKEKMLKKKSVRKHYEASDPEIDILDSFLKAKECKGLNCNVQKSKQKSKS